MGLSQTPSMIRGSTAVMGPLVFHWQLISLRRALLSSISVILRSPSAVTAEPPARPRQGQAPPRSQPPGQQTPTVALTTPAAREATMCCSCSGPAHDWTDPYESTMTQIALTDRARLIGWILRIQLHSTKHADSRFSFLVSSPTIDALSIDHCLHRERVHLLGPSFQLPLSSQVQARVPYHITVLVSPSDPQHPHGRMTQEEQANI